MKAYVPKLSVLVAIMAALSVAPACGASQRDSTIHAAIVTVDAARDGFIAFDSAKQAKIVSDATSLEQGKAALAAYRADRVKIETVFGTAYRAIAIAATLNDQPSMDGVKAAIDQVLAAIAALTGVSK